MPDPRFIAPGQQVFLANPLVEPEVSEQQRKALISALKGRATDPITFAPDVIGQVQGLLRWTDTGEPIFEDPISGDFAREAVGLDPNDPWGWLGEAIGPTGALKLFKAGLLAAIPIEMSRKGNKMVRLTHFTKRKGLRNIDPEYHGQGIRGAERELKARYPDDYVDRSYWGIGVDEGGYRKEAGLGFERYDTMIPEDQLYNATKDPDNLWANVRRTGNQEHDRLLFEREISKHYDAYYTEYAGKVDPTVVTFRPLDVERTNPRVITGKTHEFMEAVATGQAGVYDIPGTNAQIRRAPGAKEAFDVYVTKNARPEVLKFRTGMGERYDVLKNPDIGTLKRYAADISGDKARRALHDPNLDVMFGPKKWDDYAGFRYFQDTNGDWYFWDASEAIHHSVYQKIHPKKSPLEITSKAEWDVMGAFSEDVITYDDILVGNLRGYDPNTAHILDKVGKRHDTIVDALDDLGAHQKDYPGVKATFEIPDTDKYRKEYEAAQEAADKAIQDALK